MKKTKFVLAVGFLLVAPRVLRAAVDEARPVVHADTLIRGVTIPAAFKGEGGRSYPPGAYDVSVRHSPQGILIGLGKNGKPVAEAPGRFFPGVVSRFSAGGRQIHFDASSKVSFAGGGGKISCSNTLHPGGCNSGFISFPLPAVPGPVK